MATVAKIQAELDLDTGRFTGSVTSAIGEVKKFNTAVSSTDKSIKNIEKSVTGMGASLRNTMVVLGQFRAALHTLWSFTGEWVGAIVEANAKLERLQVLMKGLSHSATEAGRVTDSLRDMNYVLDKSKSTPFAIDTIADAFVKLKASGIDPTKGSLDALTDATARFGGNSEVLHRATIAIQQMAGKGVISMEELRQQLGEAVPNAMNIMAEATGMSMAKLVKTISSGQLQASGALDKLFLEMRIQFAGSSEKMMDTWTGLMQQLKTQWLLFAREVGGGSDGLFNTAKQSLRDLIQFLGSSQGKQMAREIGETIKEAAVAAADLIHWLVDNRDELIKWGKLLAEIFVIKRVTDFGMSLVGTAAKVMDFTRSMGALGTAMEAARAGTASWSAVMAAAAGPIGIAIAAIGGLIMYLNNQYDATVRAGNAIQDYYNKVARGVAVSPEEQAAAVQRLDYLARVKKAVAEANDPKIRGNQYARERVNDTLSNLMQEGREKGFNFDHGNSFTDAFQTMASKAEQLSAIYQKEVAEATQKVGKEAVIQADQAAKETVQKYGDGLAKRSDEIMTAIGPKLTEISKRLNDGAIGQDQATAERNKVLGGAIDKRIAMLQAAKTTLEEYRVNVQYDSKAVAHITDLMAANDKELQKAYDDRQTVMSKLVLLPKMNGGGKGKKNPLLEFIEQTEGKVAGLKAAIDDGNPSLAKFNKLLADGFYGKGQSPALIDRARAALVELGKEQDKKKIEAIKDDIAALQEQADNQVALSKLEAENDMYRQVATNMVQFNRKIAEMRQKWIDAHGSVEGFNKEIEKTQADMAALDFNNLKKFVADAGWNAYLDSLPDRARALAEMNHELEMNAQMIQLMKDKDPDHAAEIMEQGNKMVDAINMRYANATRPAWRKLIDEWQDTTTQMDQVWGNAMNQMANTLVSFVMTGKASFKDLMKAVLTEITRVLISKALAQLVEIMVNAFGSGGTFTGYSGSSVDASGTSSVYEGDVGVAANGALFNNGVGQFHNGVAVRAFGSGNPFLNSVVNKPTMAPMALFGEAGPEAIMPLTRDSAGRLGVDANGAGGGNAVQNNVSINVQINQDGSSSGDKQSNTEQGGQIAKLLDDRVRATLTDEMRPGGILWRMRNGG